MYIFIYDSYINKKIISFISEIKTFQYGDYDVKTTRSLYENKYENETQLFFDKVLIILFDFPDFPSISAYMLLSIVWIEAFIQVIG